MNFAQSFHAYDDENIRIEFSSYTFVVVAIHNRLCFLERKYSSMHLCSMVRKSFFGFLKLF